jgi:hypothetical protein
MGSPRVKDRVVEYLTRHPGVVVWRGDISRDLNLTPEQVTSAISGIYRSHIGDARNHVVVVESGRAWRWSDAPLVPDVAPDKGKRLFEELAQTAEGRILAKGDDGKVYWVSEVA